MKQVAVIGSGVAGAALIEAAEALGRGIAERGCVRLEPLADQLAALSRIAHDPFAEVHDALASLAHALA